MSARNGRRFRRTPARAVALALVAAAAVASTPARSQDVLGGLQQMVLTQTIGKQLARDLPVRLNADATYATVGVLPGRGFAPVPVDLSVGDLARRLPPGDYTIATTAFCTQYSIHQPGTGIAYKLAPVAGTQAAALQALYWRGQLAHVSPDQMQAVGWAVQSGLTYAQMPAPYRATIDQVIPDYRSRLNADYVSDIESTYSSVAGVNRKIPPLETLLASMGPPGQLMLDAKRQREIIAANYTSDEVRNQRLFQGQGQAVQAMQAVDGPWTVVTPNAAWERFVVQGGNLRPNVLQVRVAPGTAGPTVAELFGLRVATGAPGDAQPVVLGPGTIGHAPVALVGNGNIGYAVGQGAQALITVPPLGLDPVGHRAWPIAQGPPALTGGSPQPVTTTPSGATPAPASTTYPTWKAAPGGAPYPSDANVDQALTNAANYPRSCLYAAYAIDVVARDLWHRRYVMGKSHGGTAAEHAQYYKRQAQLRKEIATATKFGCPYDPHATGEVQKPMTNYPPHASPPW